MKGGLGENFFIKKLSLGKVKIMTDLQMMIFEFGSKGYSCSQILMLLALQMQGQENPALVRASNALAQGIANGGKTCGALTGGLCLISLYTAKGSDSDRGDDREAVMWEELEDWFNSEICQNKSNYCDDILGLNENNSMNINRLAHGGAICANMVAKVFEKCLEILQKYEIDPRSEKEDF